MSAAPAANEKSSLGSPLLFPHSPVVLLKQPSPGEVDTASIEGRNCAVTVFPLASRMTTVPFTNITEKTFPTLLDVTACPLRYTDPPSSTTTVSAPSRTASRRMTVAAPSADSLRNDVHVPVAAHGPLRFSVEIAFVRDAVVRDAVRVPEGAAAPPHRLPI